MQCQFVLQWNVRIVFISQFIYEIIIIGILNLCYEKENVSKLLSCNGLILLVQLLEAEDESLELQSSAMGAIQSIVFQSEGKENFSDSLYLHKIFPFLETENRKLLIRSVGVLHNLSTYVPILIQFRNQNAVELILRLLWYNSYHLENLFVG